MSFNFVLLLSALLTRLRLNLHFLSGAQEARLFRLSVPNRNTQQPRQSDCRRFSCFRLIHGSNTSSTGHSGSPHTRAVHARTPHSYSFVNYAQIIQYLNKITNRNTDIVSYLARIIFCICRIYGWTLVAVLSVALRVAPSQTEPS